MSQGCFCQTRRYDYFESAFQLCTVRPNVWQTASVFNVSAIRLMLDFILYQKVFAEAEEMAKKYRQKMPAVSAAQKSDPLPANSIPFEDEENILANWKWFIFDKDGVPNP